ncbi:MAG: DUF3024 domain-containing protein [Gemmatimonadaceae bacterium]
MAIPESQRRAISRLLSDYCAPHPRAAIRRQLRHGFEISPHHIVLFEKRPHFDRPQDWLRLDVAKFRWYQSRREWHLYCQFRDLKWYIYEPRPWARRFETLLAEVEKDPTGIFWG